MKKTPKHERGFALVVVLTLMILLSILAVGMLSLSSVSLRQSSLNSATATARANARMALMLAIGELQSHLGPDRRVNITASQLSNDGGNTSAAAGGRGHWLGVYDSWDSTTSTTRPVPAFRRWLVSGDMIQLSSEGTVKSPSTVDVTLWEGVAADGADRVAVPKVKLGSGAYAWWVGDENSKALIGKLPEGMQQLEHAWSNAQSAPTTAHHLHPALSNIARDSSKIEHLASHRSLDLLAGNTSASNQIFHDFTTASLGVITDVARGGLKRDLSLFLDHPVSKDVAVKLPNQKALYPQGITWEELWIFHNAWRALEPPAAGLASMTGGNLSGCQILMTKPGVGAASISAFTSDPFALYKLPNFIRSQWLLSLWAKVKPNTTPTAYDLHWVSDGILTLWNPFDVPLALHPDSLISMKYWNIPYTIRLFDGSELVAQNTFTNATGNSSGHSFTMMFGTAPNPYWTRLGTPDPVVLMPGEVLVMSQGPGNGDPVPYAGRVSLAMKAGWNLGRGFSFPVTPTKPISASSNLNYRVTANGETAYQNHLVLMHSYYGPDNRGGAQPDNTLCIGVGGRQVTPEDASKATSHRDMFPTVSGDLPAIPSMTGQGKHHPAFFPPGEDGRQCHLMDAHS